MASRWANKAGAKFQIKGLPGTFTVTHNQGGPDSTTRVRYDTPPDSGGGVRCGFYHYLFIPEDFEYATPDEDGYYERHGLEFKPFEPGPEYELGRAYVDACGDVLLRGRSKTFGGPLGFFNHCGDFYEDHDPYIAYPLKPMTPEES